MNKRTNGSMESECIHCDTSARFLNLIEVQKLTNWWERTTFQIPFHFIPQTPPTSSEQLDLKEKKFILSTNPSSINVYFNMKEQFSYFYIFI